MIVEINLMSIEWSQYVASPDSFIKGHLRATLRDAGRRDGVAITRTLLMPHLIRYTFDKSENKV